MGLTMTIRLQSVLHVNLNCRDRYKSRDMLAHLGFQPASVLKPEPQDGADMGVDGLVQWDGFAMISSAAWDSAMIDLLSFNLPPVVGRAYPTLDHIGYNRLLVNVVDINQVYAQLSAETQIVSLSSLCTNEQAADNEQAKQVAFSCRDTDGICYDIIQAANNQTPGLSGVVVSCADLNKTRDWYTHRLGLKAIAEPRDLTLLISRYTSDNQQQSIQVRSCDLQLPDRNDFIIRLQQAETAYGEPYQEVNHVGLYRMAFAVADIQAAYQQLLAADVNCPKPPVFQDMGEGVPVDGVWALFFYDPDGICVELIQPPKF